MQEKPRLPPTTFDCRGDQLLLSITLRECCHSFFNRLPEGFCSLLWPLPAAGSASSRDFSAFRALECRACRPSHVQQTPRPWRSTSGH